MRVRRTLAALLAVPWLFVAACGGGSSVADPPISSAPTSAPTRSPAPETAEHFIRRWVAASNAMESGGSTKLYLALTHGCTPCNQLARQISDSRRKGGFYKSQGWTIKKLAPIASPPETVVDVTVDSAPTLYKQSATSPVRRYTGGHLTFRIFGKRLGNQWKVTNVAQIAG